MFPVSAFCRGAIDPRQVGPVCSCMIFASVAAQTGMSLPLIGSQLGHNETATTARYAHLSDDPQSDAAALISERIAAAMASGSTGDGGTEVVPISSSSPRHERQVRYSTCLSTRVICVTRVSGLRSQFRSVG